MVERDQGLGWGTSSRGVGGSGVSRGGRGGGAGGDPAQHSLPGSTAYQESFRSQLAAREVARQRMLSSLHRTQDELLVAEEERQLALAISLSLGLTPEPSSPPPPYIDYPDVPRPPSLPPTLSLPHPSTSRTSHLPASFLHPTPHHAARHHFSHTSSVVDADEGEEGEEGEEEGVGGRSRAGSSYFTPASVRSSVGLAGS
ncbi:hypothetical protein QJQ45_016744, partial [Haematococcus lacustris]